MISGDQNSVIESLRSEIQPSIFFGGALLTILAIGIIALRPTAAGKSLTAANTWLWTNLSWVYLWAMFLSVVFCLWLLVGPWGRIKLGSEDAEPEFSFFEFFAMLFSAGLSTGLVFFGPAEALFHYETAPPFLDASATSAGIIPGAIRYTLLHWGISPWSAYLIFGITIAYYVHRRGAPIKPSTVFAPFIGVENLDSKWVNLLDIGMVVVSVGGVAVSLGFVVTQFLTGLNYKWGVQFGDTGTLLITVGLTAGFTISAALGVERGIRRISNFNMYLFAILLGMMFVFGPSAYLLNLGTEAFGGYVKEFVGMSLYTNVSHQGKWVGGWTVFYWGWWFSFAPMIGIFMARICRGRTIRQVTFAGIAGTSAASFPWFVVMGGSSVWAQHTGRIAILSVISKYGMEVAGFPLFEYLMPFGSVFSALYLLLVLTFLITTVDSTTLSLAMFTTGGNENPSTANRVTWGVLVGLLTSLLLITGGLAALKDLVVLLGLPMAIVCVLCFVGLTLELEQDFPVILTERYPHEDDADSDTQSLIGFISSKGNTSPSDD